MCRLHTSDPNVLKTANLAVKQKSKFSLRRRNHYRGRGIDRHRLLSDNRAVEQGYFADGRESEEDFFLVVDIEYSDEGCSLVAKLLLLPPIRFAIRLPKFAEMSLPWFRLFSLYSPSFSSLRIVFGMADECARWFPLLNHQLQKAGL